MVLLWRVFLRVADHEPVRCAPLHSSLDDANAKRDF
jgi:hypothetical protein